MKSFLVFCCLFFVIYANAQPADSVLQRKDSSMFLQMVPQVNEYQQMLHSNIFVNTKGKPEAFNIRVKKHGSSFFFYVILGLLMVLGILKTLYSRYFNTLFRVFFNTSIRQNQLTDQLEQASVPSFLFNIFFVLSAGLYFYLLLHQFSPSNGLDLHLLEICIPAVAICYLGKYLSLRFTGWITNYQQEASTYIFIIFLLNKVIGVLLLPFIVLMMFSPSKMASVAFFISLIALALILLLRFFRAYSLLQNKLKITGFHFFLYLAALEILPIALIYKAVMLFIAKTS